MAIDVDMGDVVVDSVSVVMPVIEVTVVMVAVAGIVTVSLRIS